MRAIDRDDPDIWTAPEELDQIKKFAGFDPALAIEISATCNEKESDPILGELVLACARGINGIVDFLGELRIDDEARSQLLGRSARIFYDVGDRILGYIISDADFLQAWLKPDRPHIVMQSAFGPGKKVKVTMMSKKKTYVALLRGINNVGTRRVAMADLRALFESIGLRDVQTLLNSGNVIFSVPEKWRGDVRARIEKAIASKLGINSAVIILSRDEITVVVRENPLSKIATNPSHLLVFVPQDQSDPALLKPLVKKEWAPEMLAVGKHAAYVWCANGVAKSPLWAAVDRASERRGTARNISTLTKAVALIEKSVS